MPQRRVAIRPIRKKRKERVLKEKPLKQNKQVTKKKKLTQQIKPTKTIKKSSKKTNIIKEQFVGLITHYFDQIQVAVVKLKKEVKKGDKIHIKGEETDFKQPIKSMQINRQDIPRAKKGQSIGLKLIKKARPQDKIFR